MTDRWRNADYLRKQAASEEVEQPATLTGDSYTDLRRDGGEMRGDDESEMGNERGSKSGGSKTRAHTHLLISYIYLDFKLQPCYRHIQLN